MPDISGYIQERVNPVLACSLFKIIMVVKGLKFGAGHMAK